MKLGNYAHISVSVQRLKESAAFYEQLGFRKLWENTDPYPWMLMTDGRLNLHLYELYFSSPALHYFSAQMQEKVAELMNLGIRPEVQKSKDGSRVQHNFLDPNELTIMLMHFDDGTMPKPNGFSQSKLGVFGELSVDTENIQDSIAFWQKLDFTITLRGETPYPWATLTDGAITLSFHQTRLFPTPALTYFAVNPAKPVHELRAAGVSTLQELHDERGNIAGALITAPDGQVFLLLEGNL